MSKAIKALAKTLETSLPAHLQNYEGPTGLENAMQYMSPARLKIMQGQKGEEYDAFEVGTVIVIPSKISVCLPEGAFTFTPIFFFDEFCCHNPWNLRDTLTDMIRERTFDSDSELALKCKAMTSEPCPENEKESINYYTHLNMAMVLHGIPDLEDVLILASYYSGEFKTGRAMIDLLRVRCSGGQPIYATILQATQGKHKSRDGQNRWEGTDITNPAADMGDSWVMDPEKFILYGKMAAETEENMERIITTHEYDKRESVDAEPVTSDTL